MQSDLRSGTGGKLPVFVFPSSLTFVADDQNTHKQVLTLYNPYEFGLTFKVLSNAPTKYVVVDSEGNIKAKCCVDIVVRHKAIHRSNYGVSDKLRISIAEQGLKSGLTGKKDISSTLQQFHSDRSLGGAADSEVFHQVATASVGDTRQQSVAAPTQTAPPAPFGIRANFINRGAPGVNSPNYVVIVVAIICILALMLPTHGVKAEQSPSIPAYLHLTVNQKLIFAYALGLVTMVILRT